MPESRPALARTALIVGCGYLGGRVAARLLQRGATVFATTRREHRARELARLGMRPLILSVQQPLTFAALDPALAAEALDVYYLVPPGRLGPGPADPALEGLRQTLLALRRARVRRAVTTSSTAVYGQQGGVRVDADSPAEARTERAAQLLRCEQAWLDAGPAYYVVRLAGLYGPGRVIGLGRVREGAPIVGDPTAMLNLVHVDDAADLLLAVMGRPQCARIELGCDGHPVPRERYYRELADRIGVPAPGVLGTDEARRLGLDVDRLQRSSSKICANDPTRLRTGWEPRFASYREGLDAIEPLAVRD